MGCGVAPKVLHDSWDKVWLLGCLLHGPWWVGKGQISTINKSELLNEANGRGGGGKGVCN